MTDIQMLTGLVCILALLLALNLKLTFTLYNKLKIMPGFSRMADPLAEGTILPEIVGDCLLDAKSVLLWRPGVATAVLMFASRCSKCKVKLPEVPELLALADGNGLEIKLVTTEPVRQFRRFLSNDKLAFHSMKISQADYLQLNPQQVSPAYVFIDQQGKVEATGIIGDENWTLFSKQLLAFSDTQQSVA